MNGKTNLDSHNRGSPRVVRPAGASVPAFSEIDKDGFVFVSATESP